MNSCVFLVQPPEKKESTSESKPVPFSITPEVVTNVKNREKLPKFLIEGQFDHTNWSVDQPFSGELTVHHSDVEIRSIELQFVRVETVVFEDGPQREATEIQNVQLTDGQPALDVGVPIWMIFPKIFTAKTLVTKTIKVPWTVWSFVLCCRFF